MSHVVRMFIAPDLTQLVELSRIDHRNRALFEYALRKSVQHSVVLTRTGQARTRTRTKPTRIRTRTRTRTRLARTRTRTSFTVTLQVAAKRTIAIKQQQ